MNESINVFNEKGYCKIKNAVPSDLRDFITQYALFDEMQDFNADVVQVPNAHAKYGDPAMETLLLMLQPLIEESTGLSLYPTYSFFRVYRPFDVLEKHKDRSSCEISATVCFNYDYENENFSWPIFMEGTPVIQEPGDLVVYRGCDVEHWRNEFNLEKENAWHVQGFFHYVDANGSYRDWKWDKRGSIGAPRPELKKKDYIVFHDKIL